MEQTLDLHDKQIIKMITNPIKGSVQILIDYSIDQLLEIRIKAIKNLIQENIECLSLFYASAGWLDGGFIEDTKHEKNLNLSGIINWDQNLYNNINWSFLFTADDITINFIKKTKAEKDILMEQENIDIEKML
ncbi:hypothetical protein [Treponema socranskii]|uniref:hypothetical protein n=1 Tax=Treponema socranskii TaxID=53419 RepID=UPI0023F1E97D|nr:hypothetical protein [Treponema socranskii]